MQKSTSRSTTAKKPKGKLEAAIKKVVKNVLTNWGCYQFWPVQTGLGQRTLDCIACVPIRVTADMVGKTIGAFVAIETKREAISSPTPKQGYTMEHMRSAGGVAILVNSPSDLEVEDQLIWAIRNGLNEHGNWISLQSPYVQGMLK